ncbi:MAG: GC-type dockerin domain-anchored protein, partial [Planctomycetota bacterium]
TEGGQNVPAGLIVSEPTCDEATRCLPDTNGDGQLTPGDFNAWILAFNAQSAACDQNGDGDCEPSDFNAWILNFNAGCS